MINEELPQDFLDSLNNLETEASVVEELRNSLPAVVSRQVSQRALAKALDLLAQMEQKRDESGVAKWFAEDSKYPIHSLPKHKAFFEAGKDFPERLFMAGNRVGKSLAGAFELACHLTGDYPSWWNGRVFDHPIDAWAVGKDARAVRDTAQKELLGDVGQWGTGMIPAHRLGKFWALQGTPQAVDIIQIKHKSGGWSKLGFKNYQQDIGSFMGTSRHAVWLDEECPLEIYNECNIRTATTKGIMLVTFTPLDGLTQMVINFCKRAEFLVGAKPLVTVDDDTENLDDEEGQLLVGSHSRKAVIQAGWDDAPWLDDETKARLYEDTPIHLREARRKGLPSMGSGNIYAYALEDLLVEPFAIPESWPRMYALDVGWNRTAALWAALDPATDTLYFYDEHYVSHALPVVHAHAIRSRGEWIIGAIDPASRGRSPTDGKQLMQTYRDLGLELRPAKNEVESGITNLQHRFGSRKARIFKTLGYFQKEYLLYKRDKNGQIVKVNDHLMDCARYIINNLNFMSSKSEHASMRSFAYEPTVYNV